MELESRRVDHRVLNCEASASTAITAVSLDQWEPETTNKPPQRSAGWRSFNFPVITQEARELFWGRGLGFGCSLVFY